MPVIVPVLGVNSKPVYWVLVSTRFVIMYIAPLFGLKPVIIRFVFMPEICGLKASMVAVIDEVEVGLTLEIRALVPFAELIFE